MDFSSEKWNAAEFGFFAILYTTASTSYLYYELEIDNATNSIQKG